MIGSPLKIESVLDLWEVGKLGGGGGGGSAMYF